MVLVGLAHLNGIQVSDNYKLFGVPHSELEEFFPKISHLLSRAVQFSDGVYEVEDLYKALQNKEMQLWIIYDNQYIYSAIVTEVKMFPRENHLNILFLGGMGMRDWVHIIQDFISLAKEKQCKAIKVYGRPGWERMLEKYGFYKAHIVLKHDIED